MIVFYALTVALAAGVISGGRPAGLAALRFRWSGLIVAGIVAQAFLFTGPVAERVGGLGPALYVGTTLMVLAAVVRNSSISGMPVVAAGAACNLSAVMANGGYMPASRAALELADRAVPAVYSNSTSAANPALWPLTDIFALPAGMPLANVFSVGDLLIGLGIGLVIVRALRRAGSPAEHAN
jgi:hypothetical protein